jgi:hypothetical protein
MKTLRISSFFLTTILALGCFSPSIRADETKPPAAPSPAPVQVKQPIKLINLDFPGGTVAQFVEAVTKPDNGPFNIIGEKEEMEVQLPPFSLRNVEFNALFTALSVLLHQRGLNLTVGGPGLSVLSKDENLRRFPVPDPTRSAFESFQLAPYLAEQSVDDIVGAIHTAWELDPTHDRNALRLKFHPPTSVLLVAGPPDAITLTRNVLGQIKRSPEKTPTMPVPKSPSPPEAEKK